MVKPAVVILVEQAICLASGAQVPFSMHHPQYRSPLIRVFIGIPRGEVVSNGTAAKIPDIY